MSNSFALILAATPRSFEYIKTIHNIDAVIEKVFLLDDFSHLPGQRKIDANGLMSNNILDFCSYKEIEVCRCEADVNSLETLLKIKKTVSDLIIYSGYGGQIINNALLNLNKKILHIHAGSLPDYRGSTTIYYTVLNKHKCGVTAILLDKNIDTGIIVGEMEFSNPEPGVDYDYDVDINYRVQLLSKVARYYKENGCFKSYTKQDLNKGKTYYVAHPVLRHIAILQN